MRHGKKINHLGRKKAHRKSMLANMASSLIEHKRINTTVAKAKALRQFVEPIITKSKEDTTHNRRLVFAELRQKEAVTELFREVAPKVGDRPGGYTRIIKLGNRLGDNADMAMIELVDFNELYNTDKPEKKTRRSRRGKGNAPAKATASEGETSAKATASEGKTEKREAEAKPDAQPKSEEVKPSTAEENKAQEETKREEAQASEGKDETKPAPEAKQDEPKKNKDQI